MNVSQERGKKRIKCIKCGKVGHYAKCCRSTRKINFNAFEKTYNVDEDDWIPDRIHSIQQKIHSIGRKSKNGPPFCTKTLLFNNRPIKFIVDTGSPVILIPKMKFNKITTIKPVIEDYRDVNDNEIKLEGKTIANIESDGNVRQLQLLITTRQTHPLLGVNLIETFGRTLKTETPHLAINNIDKPDADKTTLKSKFHKLFFTKNHS